MTLSFDILLLYYDDPVTLDHFLARTLLQSDFMQFADRGNIIITDTGSPRDNVDDTLRVLRRWAPYKRAIYVRPDTEAIRAAAPPGTHARPSAYAFNICTNQISRADVIVHAILGNIFLPTYFNDLLKLHEEQPRVFVQPKQHRLHSKMYHQMFFDQPIERALTSGQVTEWNGLPDFSVRREHLQAVGGWDQDFITWGMTDIDLASRLCGMIDHPIPAHVWFQNHFGTPREPYANYGLTHVMPNTRRLFSLICNDYGKHLPDNDASRMNGLKLTMELYLSRWGVIERNKNPQVMTYRVYDY